MTRIRVDGLRESRARPLAWLTLAAVVAVAIVALAPRRAPAGEQEPEPEHATEQGAWVCPMLACDRPGPHVFSIELYTQRFVGL
jgi:hypothetical protein